MPGCFDTIVIPAGITITITDQTDLTACGDTYILVEGELAFQSGKKLDLPCGSVVYMVPGPPAGLLTGGGGGGNSNYIKICGTTFWKAGDGNLTGPAILCEACSLPIELVSFTATMSSSLREVNLYWETASETDNDFFTIEKSQFGQNWVEVGEIDGAGNSSVSLNYHEVDFSPYFGSSYYRLKQTDFNGDFEYSATVRVDNNIVVYPNPVIQGDNLIINFPADVLLARTRIVSLDGKIVYELEKDISDVHQLIIPIGPEFATGVYTVISNNLATKLVVK